MAAPSKGAGGIGALTYAALCYVAVVAALLYAILFVNGVFVPTRVDDSPVRATAMALTIDLVLIFSWGVQHSLMARSGFKAALTRLVPAHVERSTYCLISVVVLMTICVCWSPIAGQVWSLQAAPIYYGLHAVGIAGWIFLLIATFEIDHFELFGLKQAWYAWRGRQLPAAEFQARAIYSRVRHPIQTGALVGMWVTPNMSASRLLFASLMSVYVLIGLYFEERDLVGEYGDRYRQYRRRVPMLLPRPWRRQ